MTSANERQYQLPFCQVLAAEGETILYVSTHGPLEKGKDVITRTPSGDVRAYQLKAGDIGLAEWRAIYGEIVNLVELAVEFPGSAPVTDFRPYLVTNGEVTDPVLEQIRAANVSWRSRGINGELGVIRKGELFERFRASHGSYLPRELEDFRTFLELILRDGSAPADKAKASRLIEHLMPLEPQKESVLNIRRVAASIVLMAAYITGPAALAGNHWSIFEHWVLAGAYILYLIENSKEAEADCEVSFQLCEMAADAALAAIAEECSQRTDLVQGSPLVDGHVYRPRVTILIGLLCAWDLSRRVRHRPSEKAAFISEFIRKRLKEAVVWGESAVPYFFLAGLELEQNCRPGLAEGVVIRLVRDISGANGAAATGRGLCSPYYSPEEAMRLNYGLDPLNAEQFAGFSYSLASLIDFLARRWRRQALASLWFGLTRLCFMTYLPAAAPEWFRWKSFDGTLDSTLAQEPQSWEALRVRAETRSIEGLPPVLAKRPAFAMWFVLVYPQRFTPAVAKLIEDALIL